MIATIHDLTSVEHPEFYGKGLLAFLATWLEPSIRAADQLVAISNETRDSLKKNFGVPDERICVIPQPIQDAYLLRCSQEDVKAGLNSLGIHNPFFLHVSNLAPHKNVSFVIDAFAEFVSANSSHMLIICGGGPAPNQPPNFIEYSKHKGIEQHVRYLGRMTTNQLRVLYQGCKAFPFPSYCEGWGLPVAEALSMGAKVLASPFVPSAPTELRYQLDVTLWATIMAQEGKDSYKAPTNEQAGLQLFEVLCKVNENSRHKVIGNQATMLGEKVHHASPDRSLTLSVRKPHISGCTIVRNAVVLNYPLFQSVASYAPLCDEIVICWDPTSEDDSAELVRDIARRFSQVRLVESCWDMKNRLDGSELARQTQFAFDQCHGNWTLYIQADEALHERDHAMILSITKDINLSGVFFERRSFFRSLDSEIPAHYAAVLRLFRTGQGRSLGDAMQVGLKGDPGKVLQSPVTLFNYSRIGDDTEIALRSDNLNQFYHDDTYISQLPADRNQHWRTVPYHDSHPQPIEERFRSTLTQNIGIRVSEMQSATNAEVLNIIITVDDIRPQPECGLELESGCMAMLRELNARVGCQFTLFMPTNYHTSFDLRDHSEWFRAIIGIGCFEVACHGHHHWNVVGDQADQEYLFDNEDQARWCVERSMAVLRDLGHRPLGVKAPGWGYSPAALSAIRANFLYQADHFVGTDCLAGGNGLIRLPYTRCIHQPMEDLLGSRGACVVLHSHFSPEGGKHDNGWDRENLSRVVTFLTRLTEARGDCHWPLQIRPGVATSN